MARRTAAALAAPAWPGEPAAPWAGAAYKPLYALLAEHLEGRIRAGQFAEGAYLPGLRDMTRLFGVGLSTARGAVRELRRRGLVDVRHGSGIRVIFRSATPAARGGEPLDVARDIRDLFAARELLEPAALESAMGRIDAGVLTELYGRTAGGGCATPATTHSRDRLCYTGTPETAHSRGRLCYTGNGDNGTGGDCATPTLGQRRAVFEVDKRMHDEIFAKCANPYLREALAEVMKRIELYREINFRRYYARGSEEDRRTIGEIVRGIAAGDASGATAALRKHIRFTRDKLLQFVPHQRRKG